MAIIAEKGPWNLHDTAGKKQWAVEVSDIAVNVGEQRCPACNMALRWGFGVGEVLPIKGEEDNILFWSGVCICGVELIIFND